ncbi:MAG TPA: MCE family protein [Acidimicrobiales bacterium]|nr:MCE family protein [Acidimicrobiales bacterium]
MTVLTAERRRFSVEALQQSRTARALSGVVLAALIFGVAYLIVLAFTGSFTNVVRIRAQLPAGSNAVPIAAPVEFRNVTVGKVGSETPGPGGKIAVEFDIYPRFLPRIPAGVQAQVSPLSIFGNQYVDLVPPAVASPAHLERGAFIPAYTGTPSTSLQGTVSQLYDLLAAINPADLDVALTSLATALQGEGKALGHTLAGTSDYLGGAVVPNLTTIGSDLHLVPPVASTVTAATPDILGTLSNTSVTAGTLTSHQQALRTLLDAGTASVGQFATILQQVQTTLPSLLNESGPLLADVTRNPDELAQTLSGLTQFASAVAQSESHGPFLEVTANLPVADISAGVNAALGYDNPASVDAALGSLVNPPTYTSADCPEYPGEANPYCGSGGSPDATPVGPASSAALVAPASADPAPAPRSAAATAGAPRSTGGTLDQGAPMPTSGELAAVSDVAAALNGGQPTPAPGLAWMVLYPLLASMVSGK